MATKCTSCSRQGRDHDRVKHKLETNLFFLCYFFFGPRVNADFHRVIIDWFNMKRDAGFTSIGMMWPRGSFKTTTFTVGRTVQRIINDPNVQILIMMNTAPIAEDKLRIIKEVLESESFQHFFPWIVPDKPKIWTKNKIQVNRSRICSDPTVSALGTESATTGTHVDEIILDDPIDGMKKDVGIQSERAMKFLSLLSGLWIDKDNPLLIVLGTKWPCEYYDEMDVPDSRFRSEKGVMLSLGSRVDDRYLKMLSELSYKTKKEKGEPVFETEAALRQSKIDFGVYYANQMENQRTSLEGKLFDRQGFRYFQWKDATEKAVGIDGVYWPLSMMRIQLLADVASGKHSRGDDSAIVVLASMKDAGVSFLLYAWSGILIMNKFTKKIFEVADRFEVTTIRPEETAIGEGFVHLLRFENQDREVHDQRKIPISPVIPHNVSKAARVATLQPYFSEDRYSIWLAPSDMEQFIREADGVVIRGGEIVSGNPNMVDALAYGKQIVKLRLPKVEKPDIRQEIDFDEKPRRPRRRIRCDRSYAHGGYSR